LLDAACGYQYDARTSSLTIAPRLGDTEGFRAFFLTATALKSLDIAQTDTVY